MNAPAVIVARHLSREFVVGTRAKAGLAQAVVHLIKPNRIRVKAVDDVSFSIGPGEIVGYLGPNGAGKSTTVKMLTGILTPTSGTVRVAGVEPSKDRIRNAMNVGGVFGQRTSLWWDLPAIDSFRILRRMYAIPLRDYRARLDELASVLQLSEFWDRPIRQLSLGQRVRCDLGAAMLHDPRVLFLDEPTVGMDVISKDRVREYLLHVRDDRSTTILLASHDMTDVEQLCQRILLIDRGRIMFDGGVDELKERYADHRLVRVRFSGRSTPQELPGSELVQATGSEAWYRIPHRFNNAAMMARLLRELDVVDVTIQEAALEDVIKSIYLQRSEPSEEEAVE